MSTQTRQRNTYHFTLANGGELFVTRAGKSGWSVDMWDLDATMSWLDSGHVPEPTYHAFYGEEADALADAEGWAKWPLDDDEED